MTSENAKKVLHKDVRLTSAIIGVGNAGNQFVNAAYAEGYQNVFAINTSENDLSDENLNKDIPAFLAGDEARGAGQNRQKAKDLFAFNGENLFRLPRFMDMIQQSDTVYITGSTDGGSGSGIAPEILRLLIAMFKNKIIIYYGSLPKLSTLSPTAHKNMIECLHEINTLNIPYMLADLSHFENVENHTAYKLMAKHIINSIDIIGGKYLNSTSGDSIDQNDMRTIISQPGYMTTYMLDKITTTQIEKESIQSQLIRLIGNSPAVAIQKDKIIKQIGIISNSPVDMMETSKTGNYTELVNFVGIPQGIFKNESIYDGNVGQFMAILSGMSLPYNRILQSMAIIEEHEEALKRTKSIDLTGHVSKLSFLDDSSTRDKLVNSTNTPPENVNDILGNFFNRKK